MEIKINKDTYFIIKKRDKNPTSNYNMFINVAKNSKNNIIVGWMEKHTIDDFELLESAIKSINEYENQKPLF